MSYALTSEQVRQVVNNTVLVLLVRPDLMAEWHTNLLDLLKQAREAHLEDETVFLAAVLTLLHFPDDTLPTGTTYDRAWESILVGLQTGVVQQGPAAESETMTLDRLLSSVVQATIAVMTRATEQKDIIQDELREMRASASESGVAELVAWLDDVLAVLNGGIAKNLGTGHQGIYAVYWNTLAQNLKRGD